MHRLVLLVLSHVYLSCGRDIVFPPVNPSQWASPQKPLRAQTNDQLFGLDVETGFGMGLPGLTTFANLPYVNCLSEKSDVEKYDIAILGAPFDTVSCVCYSFRTRFT
jgi:agmatinase